jgi:hypothetical protein
MDTPFKWDLQHVQWPEVNLKTHSLTAHYTTWQQSYPVMCEACRSFTQKLLALNANEKSQLKEKLSNSHQFWRCLDTCLSASFAGSWPTLLWDLTSMIWTPYYIDPFMKKIPGCETNLTHTFNRSLKVFEREKTIFAQVMHKGLTTRTWHIFIFFSQCDCSSVHVR